jgi:hypothetical protein
VLSWCRGALSLRGVSPAPSIAVILLSGVVAVMHWRVVRCDLSRILLRAVRSPLLARGMKEAVVRRNVRLVGLLAERMVATRAGVSWTKGGAEAPPGERTPVSMP